MKKYNTRYNYVNNIIRLRLTSKCTLACSYCHKEGGKDIDDIQWNKNTMQTLKLVKQKIGSTEIHYTGGEPSCNKSLETLTSGIIKLGFTVKMTSNAQFSLRRLTRLVETGLKNMNFSIISFDPNEFIRHQNKKDLKWATHCIHLQRQVILRAIALGCRIKLNVIVSDYGDINRVINLYHFAKLNKIQIRFLNNLYSDNDAINAINFIVAEGIMAEKYGERIVLGSSSAISYYRDKDGFEFGVKEIRSNKLQSLCADCKLINDCIEQFYGIRLEQNDNEFFVRLCLLRDDEKSYIPLTSFWETEQWREFEDLSRTLENQKGRF